MSSMPAPATVARAVSDPIEVAIARARRERVPLFPCRADKSPACPRGFLAATADPEALADLFRAYPGQLIGMPTGQVSGIAVLDLDTPRHPEAARWLNSNQDRLPQTKIVETRSGGRHYYFRHRPGIRCSAGKIAPGVDIRADGGYVIRWDTLGFPTLLDLPLAEFPDWLASPSRASAPEPAPLTPISPHPTPAINLPDSEAWAARATLFDAWRTVSSAPEGTRNTTLNAHAYRVRQWVQAGAIDRTETKEFLLQASAAAGLDRREASRTIESAFSGEGSPPATAPQAPPAPSIFDLRLPDGPISNWLHIPPPPPTFVVQDFALMGATTLLAGEGGAGKSHIALAGMISVATGNPFFGKATLQGRAVGVFGEDTEGALHARLNRICNARGMACANLAGRVFPVSVADNPSRALLWQNGGPTLALADLEATCRDVADLRLLVLDNATLLADLDENIRREVAAFLSYLNGLASRLQCAVLLVHHAAKSADGSSLRMASGSTAWINQSRAAAEIRKASGNDPARLSVRKINDGREWSANLTWSADGTLIAADDAEPKQRAEDAFLAALRKLKDRGRHAVSVKQSPYYAPKQMAGMPEVKGLTKVDLEDAMVRLLDSHRIKTAVVGRQANRQKRFGLVISDPDQIARGCLALPTEIV